MKVALIDNGSLEPAAHRNLRALAAALSARTGVAVEAISWQHSNRIPPSVLDGNPAWTLTSWVSAQADGGAQDLVFVPFFINAQGAIGSALRADLERLQHQLGGFRFAFTPGLAVPGALVRITVDHVRETIAANGLVRPRVIVVDHGGPSGTSAALRNSIAAAVGHTLAEEVASTTAASLEGEDYEHARPLFADVLGSPACDHGDVVVAPLFLAPGRHAGPKGDLAELATEAEDRTSSAAPLRCHFTALVGTHPHVLDVLADGLNSTLSTFHAAA
jgi:sirohydrochlorin ferrochelatase